MAEENKDVQTEEAEVETTEEVEATEEVQELTEEEKLQQEITALQARVEEEEAKYLRLLADMDNMRRRQATEREAAQKYRAQALLTDLLPVLDNFERALQVEATTEETASIVKGVDMVYRSLLEAVKKEGLEAIPAEGEVFDPNVHQAVMQEADADKESGIVLREMQKGYQLKDRVIRPSMVSVNE
ncbi:MAG TPA: nucleotide exchange factor GrpE [Metalysinibacillus jejuensis]|uniref:Protein GrpE n=1 Tax=Metalysinibacillus jejuensis TaxID=914327 RepID=A0A921T599_9BACL|nr:nucleotide exchange factor GrpE [Metalysinibacillus jejuensis]